MQPSPATQSQPLRVERSSVFLQACRLIALCALLVSLSLWTLSYLNIFMESADLRHNIWLEEGCLKWRIRGGSFSGHKATFKSLGFRDMKTTWRIPKVDFGWSSDLLATAIPLWIPTAFSLAAFVALFRPGGPFRTRRRRKLGLCLHCGYDLRGSSGRCPECGTTTPRRDRVRSHSSEMDS